jgi:Flp pilus assembly protein TadD
MGKFRGKFSLFPRKQILKRFAGIRIAFCFMALMIKSLPAAQQDGPGKTNDSAALLKTASALHERSDYAHSIPILQRIVRLSARNYEANLLLGEDLLRSGKPREALGPLRTASELKNDDLVALDYMMMAAEAYGDSATESEALESVVSRSGGDERHLLAWGIFCLNRFRSLRTQLLNSKEGQAAELRLAAWGNPGGIEANQAMLEKSAADDPEQAGIWGELGLAQLEAGKQTEARASLKEAETREPQEAATLRLEALLAGADNNWPAAENRLLALGDRSPAELANAIRLWPPYIMPQPSVDGEVWTCIRKPSTPCSLTAAPSKGGEGLSAKELFAEGRWEQLKALHVAATGDASEWLWHGVADFRTGDCPPAIPALERGLKANQSEASFYLQACYAKEEARVEDRLSRAENQGALHELRGERAFSVQNDPASAQKEYAEATLSRPKDAYLLSRLAVTYWQLGDTAHARNTALSALAVDPGQTSALDTLAHLDMNERNYSDALVRLKHLATLVPGDTRIQVDLGITYGQLGQSALAVHYLGPPLAAGFPDTRGALHALLATALRKLGRVEEAKQATAEAARLSNQALQSDNSNRSKNVE